MSVLWWKRWLGHNTFMDIRGLKLNSLFFTSWTPPCYPRPNTNHEAKLTKLFLWCEYRKYIQYIQIHIVNSYYELEITKRHFNFIYNTLFISFAHMFVCNLLLWTWFRPTSNGQISFKVSRLIEDRWDTIIWKNK